MKEHEEQDRFAAERKLKTEQKLVAEQTQAAEQPLIHNREISAVDRPEDLGEQREEEQEEAEDEEELRRSMAWGIHNQKGTTPDQRVAWALRINRHHKKLADSLVEETERALQAVSHCVNVYYGSNMADALETVLSTPLHRAKRARNQ